MKGLIIRQSYFNSTNSLTPKEHIGKIVNLHTDCSNPENCYFYTFNPENKMAKLEGEFEFTIYKKDVILIEKCQTCIFNDNSVFKNPCNICQLILYHVLNL